MTQSFKQLEKLATSEGKLDTIETQIGKKHEHKNNNSEAMPQ